MRQQTSEISTIYVRLLILALFLVLAAAFFALVNVQPVVPLPDEKTAVVFFISQVPA